jgi:hypothetical protein
MLVAELLEWCVGYQFQWGTKHPYIDITTPRGSCVKFSFSNNSHEGGPTKWAVRARLRRTLRDLGAERRNEPTPFDEIIDKSAGDTPPEPSVFYRKTVVHTSAPTVVSNIVKPPAMETPTPPEPAVSKPEPVTLIVKENAMSNDNTSRPAGPFVKLIQSEIARATALIIQNAAVDFDKQSVSYNDGWSDERIAKVLAAAPGRELITAKHIRDMRRGAIGWTPGERDMNEVQSAKNKGFTDPVRVMKRVEALEARVEALEAAITAPRVAAE